MASEVRVSEGQRVASGDILFTLSGERISSTGNIQQQIGEQLKQRLVLLERNKALASDRSASQSRMLESRLKTIAEELQRFRQEQALLERRIALAHLHLKRQEELVAARFLSIAQLQQADMELLDIQGRQQALHRARASLIREQTELLVQQRESALRHQTLLAEIENSVALVNKSRRKSAGRSSKSTKRPLAALQPASTFSQVSRFPPAACWPA